MYKLHRKFVYFLRDYSPSFIDYLIVGVVSTLAISFPLSKLFSFIGVNPRIAILIGIAAATWITPVILDWIWDITCYFSKEQLTHLIMDWCKQQADQGKSITLKMIRKEFSEYRSDLLFDGLCEDILGMQENEFNSTEQSKINSDIEILNRVSGALAALLKRNLAPAQKQELKVTISNLNHLVVLVREYPEFHSHIKRICRLPCNSVIKLVDGTENLSSKQVRKFETLWKFLNSFSQDVKTVYSNMCNQLVTDMSAEIEAVSSVVGYDIHDQCTL